VHIRFSAFPAKRGWCYLYFLSASQSELTFFQPKWADCQKIKKGAVSKRADSSAKWG
jgi:hypothetical protein